MKFSTKNKNFTLTLLTAATAVIYYFSNPEPKSYYDYTFRVAANILGGSIGFTEKPPSWLNEFVPLDGVYYSVFPLGGVVTMMPFALLKVLGLMDAMPGAFIAALCAAISIVFLYLISKRYDISEDRQGLMIAGIMFGTWTWTNLTLAGAWQLALGFAMVGELGAIYFTIYDRRPMLAGIFFALGFGNRTEILLTAPIFFYLLTRTAGVPPAVPQASGGRFLSWAGRPRDSRRDAGGTLAWFCIGPFVLGVLTLVYNYVRFHSFTDFGYARIPGVLDEPWYDHGIFSYYYIPRQMWEMLWRPWNVRGTFPYLMPDGFSSSILWSSPFLLFSIRFGARDRALKYSSWLAVSILCVLLWMHGNSGGWQFGYRYAMVCLPWMFVILLESAPKKVTPLEWAAYIFAFAANAYATWLFHWTDYLKP
ncbi:MAG: hypothetical protein ABI791_11415 [Acidobacteriota bacterium]